MTLIGNEFGNHRDFQQPVIKSYMLGPLSSGSDHTIFVVNDQLDESLYKEATRMFIAVTDGTNLVSTPTDKIKIYMNLSTVQDISSTDTPFTYLMSSSFSLNNVRKWLYSLYLSNASSSDVYVFVQIMRFTENDDNYGCGISLDPPVVLPPT